jgi:SAM-dependent methyltransferase
VPDPDVTVDTPFATRSVLEAALARYHFYHVIEVAPGLHTAGDPQQLPPQRLTRRILDGIPLEGKRVLDVGCRDGLFSFEAERRGAAEVIGIDNDLSRGAIEVLIPHLRSRVRMVEMNVLDLRPETFGRFDVVVFAGVLYHMRYPFRALHVLRDVLVDGGVMVLETAVLDGFEAYPMLYCPVNDEGPFEATSPTFFNRRGLTDSLTSLGFTVRSIESLWPPTPAWRFLLRYVLRRRLLGGRRTAGRPDPLPVNRVAALCQAFPRDSASFVDHYWQRTHRYHTGVAGGDP